MHASPAAARFPPTKRPWPRPGAPVPPWPAARPAHSENGEVWPLFSFENPFVGGCAQLLQAALAARFGIHANHRLGARKAVAHPRAVLENQLQPIGANNFADTTPTKLARIKP